MERRLERLEQNTEKVREDVSGIKVELSRLNTLLSAHVEFSKNSMLDVQELVTQHANAIYGSDGHTGLNSRLAVLESRVQTGLKIAVVISSLVIGVIIDRITSIFR